jgi:predicted nucleotidyltransferase
MRTRANGESALLLLDAVQVLRAENVDYAIIGAMAASVHGVIRASRDADALLSIGTSALAGLERSFRTAGFNTDLRLGDALDPISAVLALRDKFENRVDLLVGIRGFDPAAFSRTIEVPFDGESLKFVGLEDFVAMKVFAGGPQDIADAKSALEAAPEPANGDLLERLAMRYGSDTARSLQSLLKSLSRDLDSGLELD